MEQQDNFKSGFTMPKLEMNLQNQHKINIGEVKKNATHFAKLDRPLAENDDLMAYIGDTISRCSAMKAMALQEILPDSSGAEAERIEVAAEKEISDVKKKKQVAQTELFNFELELKNLGINIDDIVTLIPDKSIDLLPYAIVVGEIIFNTGSFELLGDSMIVSFGIAAGISAVLFLLAKYLGKQLKEKEDKKIKIIIAVGTTIISLAIFYLIANLRSEHLKEQAHYNIHPLFLAVINLAFYIVTVWHFYTKTQPKNELDQYNRLLKHKQKHEQLKNEVVQLDETEKKLIEDKNYKVNLLNCKPEYAKRVCEQIDQWMEELINTFITTNLQHRSDKVNPSCFQFRKSNK